MVYCIDPPRPEEDIADYKYRYDAKYFKDSGQKVTYIYTERVTPQEAALIKDALKITDERLLWLYSGFTDFDFSTMEYDIDDFINDQDGIVVNVYDEEKHKKRFVFINDKYIDVYLDDNGWVYESEVISHGYLIRRDYYAGGRYYSEFFTQKSRKQVMYMRRFYNRDTSQVYDEISLSGSAKYLFSEKIVESAAQLEEIFYDSLNLSANDTIILDCCHKHLTYFTKNSKGAALMLSKNTNVFDIFND